MGIKTDDGLEFMMELMNLEGIACATVADGHVIVMTREKLLQILEALGDKKEFVLFIKRRDTKTLS